MTQLNSDALLWVTPEELEMELGHQFGVPLTVHAPEENDHGLDELSDEPWLGEDFYVEALDGDN